MALFSLKNVQSKTQNLSAILEKAIASPTLSYTLICEVDHQGLYIIFDDKEVLYIGKTNRAGKVRMQELAADFRSHTFNKKLLSKRFKDFGFDFEVLKKETKKEWIDKGRITKDDFKAHQKEVNQYIRQKLKFKFYKEQDERKLISLEHFAIAVFNPSHND
jgi:hypothetical protein